MTTSDSTAHIIDGKAIAQETLAEVKARVPLLVEQGVEPCLAVLLVGEDPASQVYVRNKLKRCEECGIRSLEYCMPSDTTEYELLRLIAELNDDDQVNGILVQLPLPDHLSGTRVIDAIAPHKDVDGFHRNNIGGLVQGRTDVLAPCTPSGCMKMLRRYIDDFDGLHAVVIGSSNIVGKPMATMLLAAGCTVSIAHSKTRDTAALARQGDIVVVAVGKAGLVKQSWIKPGAVVIDVGINQIEGGEGKRKLTGDVDFPAVSQVARAITPVPGGVGPMTIACLLDNTLRAADIQNKNRSNVGDTNAHLHAGG